MVPKDQERGLKAPTGQLALTSFSLAGIMNEESPRLASIQRIQSLHPIPGADRILMARVLGFSTVVKKDEFHEGDLCVWHEPDTIVDATHPAYGFLEKQHFRLKIARFKGQPSQGLALPLKALPTVASAVEGQDVTMAVGIRKYEKPVPAEIAGDAVGGLPLGLVRTDEPNLRSYPEALEELRPHACTVTLKLDGTSATLAWDGTRLRVCGRNYEYRESDSQAFWKVARALRLAEKLAGGDARLAIRGEVYGPGIQKNPTGVSQVSFAAFDILDLDRRRYLDPGALRDRCGELEIPVVPVVADEWRVSDLDACVRLANEQVYSNGTSAEGIVIRPLSGLRSTVLPGSRLSVKVMNENYAE